jgi:predicted nucleic acid-binding protein
MMTAALMDLIDATIVNVALPTIGRDLQASGPSLEWVVSAYLLAFAAALITAGRIGDLVGRKRMFLAGVATFGLASLACGLSRNPGELIAARAAAAIMLPQVLATLRTVFTGQERGAAFGIYGAMGGIATAAGLLLGGVLTSANILGWPAGVLVQLALPRQHHDPEPTAAPNYLRGRRVNTGARATTPSAKLGAGESGQPAVCFPVAAPAWSAWAMRTGGISRSGTGSLMYRVGAPAAQRLGVAHRRPGPGAQPLIYLDACALIKFIRPEQDTKALRAWRQALPDGTELLTGELSRLEITRTLLRAQVDHQRVPFFAGEALKGVYVVDLTSTVLLRAMAYRLPRLGSLDAIHLASADPFRAELSEFVTYEQELAKAAADLGFPVAAPS